MKKSIVVAKFGSELVVDHSGVNQDAVNSYAKGLASLHSTMSLVVVTSGAVAAGRLRLQKRGVALDSYTDATLAQVGATSVMSAWEKAFARLDIDAGGLFVTHHELEDASEGSKFVQALKNAGKKDVVSIVNANDALSDDELMELAGGGDNDWLGSHISICLSARYLNIYTKNGGLVDDSGKLIEVVDVGNIGNIRKMLSRRKRSDKARGNGKGGIGSKVEACWKASRQGIITHITAVSGEMDWHNATEIINRS